MPKGQQGRQSAAVASIIISRYKQGSLIITTNRAYKHWPEIFYNDATLTSALLDRLLHHTETVVIEGKSYRMKDVIETQIERFSFGEFCGRV